jgi:hypothetical protein
VTRRGTVRVAVIPVIALGLALTALAREAAPPSPEQVALEYGRAVYANDTDALWRLVSDADRRVKDKETFRRQQRPLHGLTREAVHLLARAITATPVGTTVTGKRANVTLKFRLPDANAPPLRTLMLGWDEDRLAALGAPAQARIRRELERLLDTGTLPTIEGDETIALVQEAGAWKVFLHWAAGVQVRFAATVEDDVPLRVTITPAHVALGRGERVRVTVRVVNASAVEMTTRVGHAIQPDGQSAHLALLQCPLFIPVTLKAGETRAFDSEYLLLADAPVSLKSLDVTYRFPVEPRDHERPTR